MPISKTEFERKRAQVLKTFDSRYSLFSGAFSLRPDTLSSLQASKKDFGLAPHKSSIISGLLLRLCTGELNVLDVNDSQSFHMLSGELHNELLLELGL